MLDFPLVSTIARKLLWCSFIEDSQACYSNTRGPLFLVLSKCICICVLPPRELVCVHLLLPAVPRESELRQHTAIAGSRCVTSAAWNYWQCPLRASHNFTSFTPPRNTCSDVLAYTNSESSTGVKVAALSDGSNLLNTHYREPACVTKLISHDEKLPATCHAELFRAASHPEPWVKLNFCCEWHPRSQFQTINFTTIYVKDGPVCAPRPMSGGHKGWQSS